MTDKKFTDEQIIKALEVCVRNDSCKECPINPNHGNYGYCTNLALTYALDLINRQKAEIERSIDECGKQSILWKQHFESIFETAKETARDEAIREFAERLKQQRMNVRGHAGCIESIVLVKEIDQIAKEMTEDQT